MLLITAKGFMLLEQLLRNFPFDFFGKSFYVITVNHQMIDNLKMDYYFARTIDFAKWNQNTKKKKHKSKALPFHFVITI